EVSLSESVMHKPLLIDEKMNLEEIAQLMMEKQQDHVFVVDGECKLTGVISGIDVVKKILDLMSA
ncbi:MAG TPA: CBS domain-containing protein, partial [Candidatus Nanoarchaeia archaeon]|nr:CBS domain-containing protein [Candidatus Nanoarchaeia archaeon]